MFFWNCSATSERRAQVSAIVNGTRGISKEQAKKLARIF
jgi:hypothetical protein